MTNLERTRERNEEIEEGQREVLRRLFTQAGMSVTDKQIDAMRLLLQAAVTVEPGPAPPRKDLLVDGGA